MDPAEIERAASAIRRATMLLVASGAGMSADSGLPVYRDVAKDVAYSSRGLDYADLCDPMWAHWDAATFWGFWGSCLEEYRSKAPHRGYETVRRWCERFWAEGGTGAEGHAFVYTSNVDGHFRRAGFPNGSLFEIHGRVDTLQCAAGPEEQGRKQQAPCCFLRWRLPANASFVIDPETHQAQPGGMRVAGREGEQVLAAAEGAEEGPPRRRRRRRAAASRASRLFCSPAPVLRPVVAAVEAVDEAAQPGGQFSVDHRLDNYPHCPRCDGPARPNVLMFRDKHWIHNTAQEEVFNEWEEIVDQRMAAAAPGTERLCVLEIGCGTRVPTVRTECEMVARDGWKHASGEGTGQARAVPDGTVTLIRVNPDEPECPALRGGGVRVVSLRATALEAIDAIEAAMQAQAQREAAAEG